VQCSIERGSEVILPRFRGSHRGDFALVSLGLVQDGSVSWIASEEPAALRSHDRHVEFGLDGDTRDRLLKAAELRGGMFEPAGFLKVEPLRGALHRGGLSLLESMADGQVASDVDPRQRVPGQWLKYSIPKASTSRIATEAVERNNRYNRYRLGVDPGDRRMENRFQFQLARTEAEFEAIHRLNHDTFVAELGQHSPSEDGRLVDKFHARNVYLMALAENQLAAMVALNSEPPFSIAARLDRPEILDDWRAQGRSLVEIRLLAARPAWRHTTLAVSLLARTLIECRERRFTDVLISGLESRRRMYERLGFESIGEPRMSGSAWYRPMKLALDRMPANMCRLAARCARSMSDGGF
jgi:predicted GNAT family N-acyltransferase